MRTLVTCTLCEGRKRIQRFREPEILETCRNCNGTGVEEIRMPERDGEADTDE